MREAKKKNSETLFTKFLLEESQEKNPFAAPRPQGGRIGDPDRKNRASLLLMAGGTDERIAKDLKMSLQTLRNLKTNANFKIIQNSRHKKFMQLLSEAIEKEVAVLLETDNANVDLKKFTLFSELSDLHHCSSDLLKFLISSLYDPEVPDRIKGKEEIFFYRQIKLEVANYILSRRKEPQLAKFGQRLMDLRAMVFNASIIKDAIEELKKPALNKEGRNMLVSSLVSVSSKFESEIAELKTEIKSEGLTKR